MEFSIAACWREGSSCISRIMRCVLIRATAQHEQYASFVIPAQPRHRAMWGVSLG